MNTEELSFSLYKVTYSKRVLQVLGRLGRAARGRGDGEVFATALRAFHRRLCVYPQFGDPLSDLKSDVGHIRIGIVPPLAMRYGVLEEKRLVIVAAVPVLMPRPRST